MIRRILSAAALAAVLVPLTAGGDPVAAQAPIEMVLTNEIATTHWSSQAMTDYAALLEQRSGGRIKPKVFHAGTLYKDKDALGALGSGTVHMVWPVSVQLENLAPKYGVVSLPFVITDELMMRPGSSRALAGMLSPYVADKGVRVMGLMRTADMIFLYRDKAITSPSALQGSKLRLTGGRVLQSLMRDLGASPISMAASEMAAALMQGAIDGIYSSAGGWEMVGVNAAKVATLVPGMNVITYTVVVDDKWLNGLPPDLRKVVEDTTEEVIASQWAQAIRHDKETMDRMVELGGKLVVVGDPERAQFEQAAAKVREGFAKRYPEAWRDMQAVLERFKS